MQPLSMASLELSVSGLGTPVVLGPTLDLDALGARVGDGAPLGQKAAGGREVLNVDTYVRQLVPRPRCARRGLPRLQPHRRVHGLEQVDGVLPYHGDQGANDRRSRERHGRPELVFGAFVRFVQVQFSSVNDAALARWRSQQTARPRWSPVRRACCPSTGSEAAPPPRQRRR